MNSWLTPPARRRRRCLNRAEMIADAEEECAQPRITLLAQCRVMVVEPLLDVADAEPGVLGCVGQQHQGEEIGGAEWVVPVRLHPTVQRVPVVNSEKSGPERGEGGL